MRTTPKRISVLGSTGSVGTNALEIIRHHPERYQVVGLSAGTDWRTLLDQIREFHPDRVSLADPEAISKIKQAFSLEDHPEPEIGTGEEGLRSVASMDRADTVLSAVVGAAGLPGTLAALRAGKRLALANKESMVMAGGLIQQMLDEYDAEIIPVDSEHASLFQLLEGTPESQVKTLYLTASGGPFRTRDPGELASVTVEEALDHPTWDMGDKITIDSATMMNKALEVIEARYLFDVDPDRIDVLVHPESSVHALVSLTDGTHMAHMGPPDMKEPIRYAFSHPQRHGSENGQLPFEDGLAFRFEPPRRKAFPALDLGYYAAREGGTTGAILNASNEVAVRAFLDEDISFTDISNVVEHVVHSHESRSVSDLDDIRKADQEGREKARKRIKHIRDEPGNNSSGEKLE